MFAAAIVEIVESAALAALSYSHSDTTGEDELTKVTINTHRFDMYFLLSVRFHIIERMRTDRALSILSSSYLYYYIII